MQKINNVEIKKMTTNEPLPAGGYVAKIMNAEEVKYSWGSQLVVSFDISEGEYKDFFAAQYRANLNEDKKWKGVYRLRIPAEDDQYYESECRVFGNFCACVEESNSGYHWNWDEKTLKGKAVGVLFRDKEWEMNGRTGMTTECCATVSVDDIKNNRFKTPKPKLLAKAAAQPTRVDLSDVEDEDDLPF